MSYFAPFLTVFVVGPALLYLLLRQNRSIVFFTSLALIAAALTIVALAIDRALLTNHNTEYNIAVIMLLALWLAWVLSIAICVRAARAQFPGPKMRRWSVIIGAMATTIPWFGLSAATYLGQ